MVAALHISTFGLEPKTTMRFGKSSFLLAVALLAQTLVLNLVLPGPCDQTTLRLLFGTTNHHASDQGMGTGSDGHPFVDPSLATTANIFK